MAKNKNANNQQMSKWDRAVKEGKGTVVFVPATLDNAVARAKAQK